MVGTHVSGVIFPRCPKIPGIDDPSKNVQGYLGQGYTFITASYDNGVGGEVSRVYYLNKF
jgi:hypothetical protein